MSKTVNSEKFEKIGDGTTEIIDGVERKKRVTPCRDDLKSHCYWCLVGALAPCVLGFMRITRTEKLFDRIFSKLVRR